MWLGDGQDLGTQKKPSMDWVISVLIDETSADIFHLKSSQLGVDPGASPKGKPFFTVLAYGVGRSDGVGRDLNVAQNDLTILEGKINGNKAKFLSLQDVDDLSVKRNEYLEARQHVREVSEHRSKR